MRNANRGGDVPLRVELHGDIDLRTEGLAQLPHRLKRLVDVLRRDELVPVARRRAVERPDLDGLDAARLDQLAHDLFRFAVEVVLVGEAGVVEADARVCFAPDQPVDGRIEVLPEQVPQGQVDGAQGPDFGAAGDLEIEGAVEIGPDPLDIARIAAEQRIGHRVNHGRLGRVARIGLSDARDASIGIDLDPGPVRPERRIVAALPVHRFDARDLRRRGGLGGGGIGAGKRGGQQPRDKRPSAERHGRIIAALRRRAKIQRVVTRLKPRHGHARM